MPDGHMQMSRLRTFDMEPPQERPFRDALGQFATGVTVVTAATDDGPIGMTANSFSSVSMEPPLVLWCPAKSSTRFELFAKAAHFAIHVLAADQRDVALAFARSGVAFGGLDLTVNAQGVPVFDRCLARFECDTHQIHDAGDHAIILGHVRSAAFGEGEPLIFAQGQFGRFDNEA